MTYRSNYPLLPQEAITLLLVKPALKDSKMHVVSCNEPKKPNYSSSLFVSKENSLSLANSSSLPKFNHKPKNPIHIKLR
jgi:hypothetical protein